MIHNITIVGVGWMGRTIAPACARGGCNVVIHDLEEEVLEQATESAKSGLNLLRENEVMTADEVTSTMSKIRGTTKLDDALKDADLVIEAVPEMLDIKKEVFGQMDKIARQETVLATNTSTLSISAIAEATGRSDRVVGIHWFYPAFIMPAVEVIRGKKTSEQTVNTARDFIENIGKVPIVCKEVPGFIINSMWLALLNTATRLLENGVATAEDIDNAMRLSLGPRLPFFGPLKIEDIVATKKTIVGAYEYMYKATGSDRYLCPELLRQMVERGELGLVSGKGYYDYTQLPVGAMARERDKMVIKMLKSMSEWGYGEYI
ncbi:MAG: 3-hydroxyacyl-CoA dehydrogenase family protein [Dehalococcoidales bacterium]